MHFHAKCHNLLIKETAVNLKKKLKKDCVLLDTILAHPEIIVHVRRCQTTAQ